MKSNFQFLARESAKLAPLCKKLFWTLVIDSLYLFDDSNITIEVNSINWVDFVCNEGYQSTKADERADDKCRE